jgi:hypothetical protein
MTTETKSQIIAAILKAEEFRAYEIVRDVGCDRQLVAYHLNKLVNDGLLLKNGKTYTVADSKALIDSLISGSAGDKSLETTPFLNGIRLGVLKNMLVYGQVTMMPSNIQFRRKVLQDIEDSIDTLKNLRYLIVNNQLKPSVARKELRKGNNEDEFVDSYVAYTAKFNVAVSHGDAVTQIRGFLKEED